MATIPERQKFLQLEAETDRSKSSIRKDKQNWADRQGKIISVCVLFSYLKVYYFY